MVDGVLLLVDALEGPLPQTRFVLRKALESRLPVILVVNKVDRPDARIAEVIYEVYELFLDLDAREAQIDFPIVYTNARAGWASKEGVRAPTSSPSWTCCSPYSRPPPTRRATPSRRTSPTSTPRPTSVASRSAGSATGPSAPARRSPGVRAGRSERRVTELYVTECSTVWRPTSRARKIIAVAGLPEVTIGETLADPEDPRPLPVITVDGAGAVRDHRPNTCPLAGLEGAKLTSRQVRDRLDAEPSATFDRVKDTSARRRGRSRAAASSSWRCSSS